LWGTCTGAFIACYTILDAWAVKSLGMDPVLFYAAGLAVRTALLAPFALAHSSSLAQHWRTSRRAIVIVGVLSPFAYLLVLFAMQLAPVSFVAPTREISMLIGTVVGARLLNESIRPAQIGAAALMLAGVAAIALA
jgi:drug/metabolite transporter (DMT)-like permease